MVIDLWGRCPTCRRWFDCDGWLDRRLPEPGCPECGAEPSEVLNLAAAIGVRVVVDLSDADAATSASDRAPRGVRLGEPAQRTGGS